MSISPATSTRLSRFARCSGATARQPCKPAPASLLIRCPPTRSWNARTRRRRCSQQRPPPGDYSRSPPVSDPFVTAVERDVVVVAGPDATSFLQSLVSQDLAPVAVGATVHALLLQPQGKLIAEFRAAHVDTDVWWLISDAGYGSVLAEGLSRFKIRIDATVSDESIRFAHLLTNQPVDTPFGCISFV